MDKTLFIILAILVVAVTAYDLSLNYAGNIGTHSFSHALNKASYTLLDFANSTDFSYISGIPGIANKSTASILNPQDFVNAARSPPGTLYNPQSLEEVQISNSTSTANATQKHSVQSVAPLQLSELNVLPENRSSHAINSLTSLFYSLSSLILSVNPISGSMAQLPVLDPLLSTSSSIGYWDPLSRLIAVEAALNMGIYPAPANYTVFSDYINQTKTDHLIGTYIPFSGVPAVQSLSEVYSYGVLLKNYAAVETELFDCGMFSNTNTTNSNVTKVQYYGISFPALNSSIPQSAPQIAITQALTGSSTEAALTYQSEIAQSWLAMGFESNATGIDAIISGRSANCRATSAPANVSYNVSTRQQLYIYSLLQYESDMVSQLFYNISIRPHIGLIGYHANETLIDIDNLNMSNGTIPIIRIDGNEVGYSRYSNFFIVHAPLSGGNHTVSFSQGTISLDGQLDVEPYIPITWYLGTNSSMEILMPGTLKYPDMKELYNLTLLDGNGSMINSYGNLSVGQSYTIINATGVGTCVQGEVKAFTLEFGSIYGDTHYLIYAKCP